jgi:restriction endonuclease S subunit
MHSGWKHVSVGEIATVVRGASPRPKGDPRYYGGSIPRLMVADVTRDGKFVTPSIDYLTEAGAARSRPMKKGTLTIVCSGAVGVPSILAVDACIHDGFLALTNVSTHVDIEFLYEVFSTLGTKFERSATHGGVFTNLTTGILRGFQILLPPHSEQLRIAEILRTWDEAIKKTSQLIAAKVAHCDHLRLRLVSWSRWPTCAIAEIISPVSRPEPTPTTAYTAVSIRSHGKGTFQRTVERPEEIEMDTVYAVGARDLIVNITFAWEGAIALAKPEDAGCFVSHRFPTFEVNEKKVNRDFLGYVIRARQFVHNLATASPGGAGRNRVLSKREFPKIEIPIPPICEQDRIAAILGAADSEISLLRSERAAFERQRCGLLQKLLTGEWGVPARDRESMVVRVSEEGAQ